MGEDDYITAYSGRLMTTQATGAPDGERARDAPWFVIALSQEQVSAGHLSRIVETFTDLFIAAGSPPGAAMFGASREDGGSALYLNSSAARPGEGFISSNAARPWPPPLDESDVGLRCGHGGEQRLLSSPV